MVLWDAKTGGEIRALVGSQGELGATKGAFTPNGRQYAIMRFEAGTTTLFDVTTGEERHRFEGNQVKMLSIAFSPDGKVLAIGNGDKTVKLWDLASYETQEFNESIAIGIAFSADEKKLAIVGGAVAVFDLATKEKIWLFNEPGYPFVSTIFSPNGETLACGNTSGMTYLWDVRTFSQKNIFYSGGWGTSIYALAFSPDSAVLALATEDGTARLLNVSSGDEIHRFVHGGAVTAVAFSVPGGKTLATASSDGTVGLWDVATGRELSRLVRVKKGEWLVEYADGRYWGSDGVHRYITFGKGLAMREVPDDYRAVMFGPRTLDQVREALAVEAARP